MSYTYYVYDNIILGSQSTSDDGEYASAPAPSSTWSWTGSTTVQEFRELEGGVNFNGDPTNETFTSEQYATNNGTSDERMVLYDYTFQVTDGTTTWDVAVVDADLNDNGTTDAGEDGYFLIFPNGAPPADTDLIVVDQGGTSISDNSDFIAHTDLGGVETPHEWLYIGDLSDMDTGQTSGEITDASPVLGNTYNAGNSQMVAVTENNVDDDLNTDNEPIYQMNYFAAPDSLTYDTGSGATTSNFDSIAVYNVTVEFTDGTVQTGEMRIVQLENGDTFITDNDGANLTGWDGKSIRNITIDSLSADGFHNYTGGRSFYQTEVVCFTAGVLIETDAGPVAVETLQPGDLVKTMDHGYQPIRWIGERKLDGLQLATAPNLRPVRIRKGALGVGLPERDLLVSLQHRILLRSKIARRMFDADEVLAAAKQLLELDGVEIADDVTQVTYVHFLCDRHEVVFAEGAPTESLYTGAQALKSLDAAAREEIFLLFPELHHATPDHRPPPARPLLNGREARNLAARHAKNAKPVLYAV